MKDTKQNEEQLAEWETEHGHTFCSLCHTPAPIKTVRTGFGTFCRRQYKPSHCPHCGATMLGGTD